MMTSFMEGSTGWATRRDVVLGLFLEPDGLPRGILVGGVVNASKVIPKGSLVRVGERKF